jgi:hypothetical protein
MARIKDTMKVISDTRGKIDKNYDMFASNIIHISNASANTYEAINNAFSLDTHRAKRQPKQKGEMCKVWWCLESLETGSFFFA